MCFLFAAPQQQVSSAMEFVHIQKKVQYHEKKLNSECTLIVSASASDIIEEEKYLVVFNAPIVSTEYKLQEREHMLYVQPPKRQKLSELISYS